MWAEFAIVLWSAQIASHYWAFNSEAEGADPAQKVVTLVPLLDMADHAEGASSKFVTKRLLNTM